MTKASRQPSIPYPDAEEAEGDPQPCVSCSVPTLWVEVNLEEFVCSEHCADTAWQTYMANR